MPERSRSKVNRLAAGFASLEKRTRGWEKAMVRPKRVLVLALGAALSVGGVSETFQKVHFLVEKNLDGVQLVAERREGGESRVVANVRSSFAASSIYKVARVIPDSLVSRRSNLFDSAWLALEEEEAGGIESRLEILNDAIRREFFSAEVPYGQLIHDKAAKYDLDPALVAAVVETESRFRPGAQSPVGARGLMQLMPRTGRWMGAKNLYDPEQNVEAGAKYLKYLEKRFKGNQTKMIAAYNAGEGTVNRYGGVPPYRETRSYVKKVMKSYEARKRQLNAYEESSDRDTR